MFYLDKEAVIDLVLVQTVLSLGGWIPALHSVYEACFETQVRICYFEGLSILRAGGRRVRHRGGSKVLANWAHAASKAV